MSSESDIVEVPILDEDSLTNAGDNAANEEPSSAIDLIENASKDDRSLETDDDVYNLSGLIDDETFDNDAGAIYAADQEMDERDRQERLQQRISRESETLPSYVMEMRKRLESTADLLAPDVVGKTKARLLLNKTRRLLENQSEQSSESTSMLGKITVEDADLKRYINIRKEMMELDNVKHAISARFAEFIRNFSQEYMKRMEAEEGGEPPASPNTQTFSTQGVEQNNLGQPTYIKVIEDTVANQSAQVPIDLTDLVAFDKQLLLLLIEYPHSVLPLFDSVVESILVEMYPNYLYIFNPRLRRVYNAGSTNQNPDFSESYKEYMENTRALHNAGMSYIHVCPYNMPYYDNIRSIRFTNINRLIEIRGVVTRRSASIPVVTLSYFRCTRCDCTQGPIVSAGVINSITNTTTNRRQLEDDDNNSNTTGIIRPRRCPFCHGRSCMVEDDARKFLYENYQKVTIQESPSDVPPGRIPSTVQVIISGNNNNNDTTNLNGQFGVCCVDCCKPGDEVEVVGIYTNSFDASSSTSTNNTAGSTSFTGTPLFTTCIEAKSIRKVGAGIRSRTITSPDDEDEYYNTKIPVHYDEQAVKQFVDYYTKNEEGKTLIPREECLYESPLLTRLIRSFAPNIYGHEDVKFCLLLSLIGGVSKEIGNSTQNTVVDELIGKSYSSNVFHRIRGDINTLIVGDPSTSKSQLLLYAYSLCTRGVYTSGKGATGVGLTATVKYNGGSSAEGGATLDAGALVLSDNGCCFIDEFDKMSSDGISSIHEAMEQQTISIAKGGIVATMNARCAVVAACNPVGISSGMNTTSGPSVYNSIYQGKYDSTKSLNGNVPFSDTVLSRFDLITIIKDIPEFDKDRQLAEAVIQEHIKLNPVEGEESEDDEEMMYEELDIKLPTTILPHAFLKEYIRVARTYKPVIKCDLSKIMQLYSEIRQLGSRGTSKTNSILTPIGVRSVQSIIRIAECIAKMHFRNVVLEADVDIAISITCELIIAQQRNVDRRTVSKALQRYIRNARQRDNDVLIMVMSGLVREQIQYELAIHDGWTDSDIKTVEVNRALFESRAKDKGIMDCSIFYDSSFFHEGGYSFDPQRLSIIKKLQ